MAKTTASAMVLSIPALCAGNRDCSRRRPNAILPLTFQSLHGRASQRCLVGRFGVALHFGDRLVPGERAHLSVAPRSANMRIVVLRRPCALQEAGSPACLTARRIIRVRLWRWIGFPLGSLRTYSPCGFTALIERFSAGIASRRGYQRQCRVCADPRAFGHRVAPALAFGRP